MCPPPKPKKPQGPPAPIQAPEIELGGADKAGDVRQRKRRGRNQLRTGLNIAASSALGAGGGLNV